MNIIEKNRESIRKLCNEHNVASLYVFGSVLTDDFGENSDIDLLENRVLKNPYMKKKIDYTKRLVYGH